MEMCKQFVGVFLLLFVAGKASLDLNKFQRKQGSSEEATQSPSQHLDSITRPSGNH
jgi:hypothetical protein